MKKISALLISALMAISLAACGSTAPLEAEGSGSWEVSADGREDSLQLYRDFFVETLEDANVVVTGKYDGETIYTEDIIGSTSCLVNSIGTHMYAFKDGEESITAVEDGESKYIIKDEDYYYDYYLYFTSLMTIKMIPEEGGTFTCVSKGQEQDKTVDGKTVTTGSGTLTFDYVSENGTINVTANTENGQLKTMTITLDDKTSNTTRVTDVTFEYGTASITAPDVTGWTDMTSSTS